MKTKCSFQAPIRAEPTSFPNPMVSSPPGPGLREKRSSFSMAPFYGLPRGPEWSNHTLGKGDTMASNRGGQSAKDSFN
jgi:hypothetical protein